MNPESLIPDSGTPITDKAEYTVRLGKHKRKVVRPSLARQFECCLAEAGEVLRMCERHLARHGHEVADEEADDSGWLVLCEVRKALANLERKEEP